MDDAAIVRLYWERNENAIPATAEKYGGYCRTIAMNILGSREDSEECLNDTWLRTWNAIPPQRPVHLGAFLGKTARNLALNRLEYNTALKRGGGERTAVLEEIGDFVPGADSTAQAFDRKELLNAIDEFLAGLPRDKRIIFVRRYWYFDAISDIASHLGKSENNIAVMLSRLRTKLRRHLEERGYNL